MDIIKKAEVFARKEYGKNDPFHQWQHVESVMKRALEIAKHLEGVDYEVLRLAVIFHDIDYYSESSYEENYKNHVENSIRVAERFLRDNGYPEERIEKVKEIMLNHSTPHRRRFGDAKLLEGKIIYDADKSLFITDSRTYKKYFPRLYLEESRRLVRKPAR